MPTQLHRKLAITLLFSLAILLALAGPSSANGISPDTARRRDHANINRMIKIRAASPALARRQLPNSNAPGAGAGNPADPSNTPSSQSPKDPLTSTSSTSSTSTSSTSSSSSTSTESTSTSSTTSKSSTTSTTPTTTPTSTPSRPTTSTTSTTSAERNVASDAPTDAPPSVESVTLTSHVAAASATNSSSNSQIGGSSLSHTTITILIVLAASIGGCAIIWTIIRKWKFRPSAQFEDRLEPVNWQPTEHDSGIPSPSHRRMASDASSFHSAGHDNMGLSRSNSGGAYNAGRSLTPLPEHDFTAGPATLAPVGGYADLTRGPSPQPQMQEALQRAPSFNQGYENYTGPAPPQEAYDYNRAGAGY